ncbi:MAG: glycosyl transferase [Actinoallomurus sp.]|jgi:galactofuranosylgalactofuranosylrhamnosyl-N-acetylglucosaminyl-diphospho-decaprenol beta-1,5/1,6-galactofuranosyltransferase|nr:glycosyl transferase [Actinoallomurus sp.]
MRVLQRVVLPVDRDLDVLKLYVEARGGRGEAAAVGTAAREVRVAGRRSAVVAPGGRASFCTYFNAFPASYWRRWSVVDRIRLRLCLSGDAIVVVYRSTGKGFVQRVTQLEVDADTAADREVELPLDPFIDGGWYWFDIAAGDREVVLERADWCADIDRPQGSTSIGITTFNRPEYCVGQLRAMGGASDVLEAVDEIFVIDQGTKRVEDQPDFAAAAEALGGRLRLIDQGNIGGSGGFSRAMTETLDAGRSDYVLLLDDDVVVEPEGILRAVAFADLARTPTIVGGHMMDIFHRSVLHVFGESIARYRWWMTPAPHTFLGHDLAAHPLRETPWLHRRVDVDYNAWWMCLIPVDVIRKIGLSLPFFIKWDDIEYGVRAREAGFPTVSLPGAAVWHVPWHSKDDTLDWQAYFTERNRLITALMYSPYSRGGNMLKESLFIATKHALAMQYSTAELMLTAVEDVLRGPDGLHPSMTTKMAELRALRADFPDARAEPDLDEFPQVKRRRPPKRGREPVPPEGRKALVRTALSSAVRQLRPVDSFSREHPEATVPHVDQTWWLLSRFDSALVSSADGTKAAWYQRDPKRFRSLVRRNAALHARLMREWPELSRRYRAAIPELTSPDSWRETFDAARREGP